MLAIRRVPTLKENLRNFQAVSGWQAEGDLNYAQCGRTRTHLYKQEDLCI